MISTGRITIIFLFSLMLLASCARVSTPEGGPKDEKPPVVINTIPPDFSTGFSSSSFEVVFDEYFVLDNVSRELMVSPPLSNKPEILTRGMSLIVKFDEEEKLRENVTYTFDFGGSIKDLNEGNTLDNFKYVFSTGDVVDSLSVTGYIYDAFNLEAGEDILVMMYSEKADSMPLTTMPLYITRASENGKYRIDNIAGGEYRLYGLRDENNNRIYDLQTEDFAFADSAISVVPENNYIPPRPDSTFFAGDTTLPEVAADTSMPLVLTDTLISDDRDGTGAAAFDPSGGDSLRYEHIPGEEYNLYYFRSPDKNRYLTGSFRPQSYLLQFTFSMPVDSSSFSITFPDAEEEAGYIREVSSGLDTFKIWLRDSSFFSRELISAHLRYPGTDSLGKLQMVTDTVKLRYAVAAADRADQQKKKAGLPLSTNLSGVVGLIPDRLPVFSFNTPVKDPDTSLIRLYMMDDSLRLRQDYDLRRDSIDIKKFVMDTGLRPDSSYVIVADSGAFKDIYGRITDSAGYTFTVRNPDEFGRLVLNTSGFEGDIIVQLLDSEEKVIKEKKIMLPGDKKFEFSYLPERTYLLKAIVDLNGDGEWTPGDYELKRQPEPVSYYHKKIEMKAGWELIEDWEISRHRQKDESVSSTRGGKK